MIKSCVTISLVTQARGGPFVFWDDLAGSCRTAGELGFDAVEIFAPSPETVSQDQLSLLLEQHRLQLAAVGTGAGWVIHRLSLTDVEATVRDRAKEFIRSMIDFGGRSGAPAIIGSMQGCWSTAVDRDTAFTYLSDALNELGQYAKQYNVALIYEPLNRYETNLVNTVSDGVALLKMLSTDNVKLLLDLFHMNIEESDLAHAIRQGGDSVGHLHFVDSNRQAAGRGHLDYQPIATALKDIGYAGYASAEALPFPGPDEAARKTIETYQKYLSE